MTRDRRDLGHISSTDWFRKEATRAEIEAERAAMGPWPWFEELWRWTDEHSTPEVRARRNRWDPPPSHSHGGKA